jgi:hypothetical protein
MAGFDAGRAAQVTNAGSATRSRPPSPLAIRRCGQLCPKACAPAKCPAYGRLPIGQLAYAGPLPDVQA